MRQRRRLILTDVIDHRIGCRQIIAATSVPQQRSSPSRVATRPRINPTGQGPALAKAVPGDVRSHSLSRAAPRSPFSTSTSSSLFHHTHDICDTPADATSTSQKSDSSIFADLPTIPSLCVIFVILVLFKDHPITSPPSSLPPLPVLPHSRVCNHPDLFRRHPILYLCL